VQHQEKAETRIPQPTSTQAPSDSHGKESEQGDGVLVVRRVQARTAPHLLVRKIREPDPSAVNTEAAFKDKLGFHDRYFGANKAQENRRMKEQARRHQLMAERHEFSEKEAWRGTIHVLQQDSPEGAKHHKKRMETIRLPQGVFARWLRDPAESILEVMQRTGSHVQVVPGRDVGLFSSLTLLGLPSQNAAARRLLQESDLLGAVSGDDLDALKSLADYHLRSEISDRHGKALEEDDKNNVGEIDESLYDLLDDVELGQLEDAVGIMTENKAVDTSTGQLESAVDEQAPTRAIWSERSATFDVKRTAKKSTGDSVPATPPPTSAVSLLARIEDLTAPIPRQVWLKSFENRDQSGAAIRRELVALLTSPENAHLVTHWAVAKALVYLAHHMKFPAIRVIMNALKDTKLVIGIDVFNTLLAAAAKAENTHAFHYIVHAMRSRGVSPDARTWTHFLTLTAKRFPEDADKVRSRMQKKAIDADLSTKIQILEDHSAALLTTFIESYPDASFQDFIKTISDDMPGVRWLTSFSANKICHHLLKAGNTSTAFEVVDELVIHGGRPDVITLNTFLGAAEKDGNMEMAVAVLRKFHDLNAKSTPLAEANADRFLTLPRVHDLSILLNPVSFQLLSSLAWERKYFNCFRVFWRYSCCAGHASANTRKKLQSSVYFGGKAHAMTRTDETTSDRARMWKSWVARFAIGVQAGLDPQGAAKVLSTARGVQTTAGNDIANATATVSSPNSHQLRPPPLSRKSRKDAVEQWLQLLAQDPKEVQSLHPTQFLVDVAEEAYRKDRQWKTDLVGLPKGLEKFDSYDHMFDHMLRDGVEVPVKAGDATAMKL
jgi:pentatricopeptide repeat protein